MDDESIMRAEKAARLMMAWIARERDLNESRATPAKHVFTVETIEGVWAVLSEPYSLHEAFRYADDVTLSFGLSGVDIAPKFHINRG